MGFRPSKVANAAMSTHLRLETGLDYIVQAMQYVWSVVFKKAAFPHGNIFVAADDEMVKKQNAYALVH